MQSRPRWARPVNRFGTDRVDIANVEALLQEAEKEGIGADHPDVIELRRQHAAGEQWNAQASLLLAEPRRHPISEWRYGLRSSEPPTDVARLRDSRVV